MAQPKHKVVSTPVVIDPESRNPAGVVSLWTVICLISAAPSFFLGVISIAEYQITAMLVGIAVFVAAYSLVDCGTRHHRLRRKKIIRRTLFLGFLSRVIISIVFPVALYLDMYSGAATSWIIAGIFRVQLLDVDPSSASWLLVFATTLVQGMVVNIVMFAYMTLLFLAHLLTDVALGNLHPFREESHH